MPATGPYKAVPFAKGTEIGAVHRPGAAQIRLTRPSPSRRGLKSPAKLTLKGNPYAYKAVPFAKGTEIIELIAEIATFPVAYKAVPFAKGTEIKIHVGCIGGHGRLTRPSPSRRGLKCLITYCIYITTSILQGRPLREGD